MPKQIITKHNALIEASYRLSLTEMQIILYGTSLINPKSEEFPLSYKIEVNKFSELFNRQYKQLYGELKETVLKRFWERDFSYIDSTGKTVLTRWLSSVTYMDFEGYIELEFSRKLQPYLHQLKSNFTTYYIDKIASFRSIHSTRIYEITLMHLKRSQSKKYDFICAISDLKMMLGIEEKYKAFRDFKKRVLEISKNQINNHSDLDFEYDVIRKGKTPVEIKFIVSYKMGREPKHQIHKTNQLEQLKSELKNVLEELKPFRTKSSFTREQDIVRLKLEKRRSELKSQLEKLSKSA